MDKLYIENLANVVVGKVHFLKIDGETLNLVEMIREAFCKSLALRNLVAKKLVEADKDIKNLKSALE